MEPREQISHGCQCGLCSSCDMRPEHFELVKADLEALIAPCERHSDTVVKLEKAFLRGLNVPTVTNKSERAV